MIRSFVVATLLLFSYVTIAGEKTQPAFFAAHCAECHSPRNFLGGIKRGQRFAGGPDFDGDGFVPNITQKALSDWSEKDIITMLETGDLPDGDRVGGAMIKVVRNTAQMSAGDRAAIAAYIKSLPPVDGPRPLPRN